MRSELWLVLTAIVYLLTEPRKMSDSLHSSEGGLVIADRISPVTTISIIATIIAEAIFLGLTWYRTWDTYRAARLLKLRLPLTTLLLRDGKRGHLSNLLAC